MFKIQINDVDFYIKSDVSVLEACEQVGIDVPRFCYHQSLSVAGNCRMCLVELSNSPKPIASCALPIAPNMKIYTDSPLVKKARENVLEALLLNHPLDCPICDQGGECDLQDQARVYGIDSSRFFFKKRVVEDKNCGSLIKTIMSRCIHCTRCVRFNDEISENSFFGTLTRGGATEIGSYTESLYKSEISANVIDLCPVGALTSNPYSFKSRPWEARTVESIDLSDGLGSNIYLSLTEAKITRIYPKSNFEINSSIISDKARFCHDSNTTNRLTRPSLAKLYRTKCLDTFFSNISDLPSQSKSLFLTSDMNDLETIFLAKTFENRKLFKISRDKNKKSISFNSKNISVNIKSENFYITWLNEIVLNLSLADRVCFLISCNIKVENAIINTKIRARQKQKNFLVFGFGVCFRDTRNVQFLNLNINKIFIVFESKDKLFSKMLIKHPRPLILFGDSFIKRGLTSNFLRCYLENKVPTVLLLKVNVASNKSSSNFFNQRSLNTRVLHKTHVICTLDLDDSCLNKRYLYKFNSEPSKKSIKKSVVVFSTHNTHLGVSAGKNIFYYPSLTEYEENRVFLNMEERIQKTAPVLYTKSTEQNTLSIKELLLRFQLSFDETKTVVYSRHFAFLREILNNKTKNRFYDIQSKKEKSFIRLKAFMINNYFLISSYPMKTATEDLFLSNKTTTNSKALNYASRKLREKVYFYPDPGYRKKVEPIFC